MAASDSKSDQKSPGSPKPTISREELLRRMQAGPQTKDAASQAEELYESLTYIGRGLHHINKGAHWTKEKVIDPVMHVLPFLKPIGRWAVKSAISFCCPNEPYLKSVKRWAHNKTSRMTFGLIKPAGTLPRGDFSKARAGILTLSLAFAAAAPFNVPIVSRASRAAWDVPFEVGLALLEVPYDATRMSVTAAFNGGHLHHGIYYLNGSTEIDPDHNVWAASGCKKEQTQNCDPDDAVYIRFKSSIMHQAWSFYNKHRMFIPDDVAGPIPNVPSRCEIIGYGYRWRWASFFQGFPQGLEAKCTVINQNSRPQDSGPVAAPPASPAPNGPGTAPAKPATPSEKPPAAAPEPKAL